MCCPRQRQNDTGELIQLDCSSSPPQVKSTTKISEYFKGWRSDMCFANSGHKSLIIVAHGYEGLIAYSTETGKVEWTLTGRLKNGKFCPVPDSQNRDATWFSVVAVDGRGHVFVGDTYHNCMYILSSNGKYLFDVNKDGDLNPNAIRGVRWCENISSFEVSHREKRSRNDTITFVELE